MRPNGPRDAVAGPDSGPEPPFPIKLSGPVIRGFGRGSKELGIPTANIPPGPLDQYPGLSTGVYYGLVGLILSGTSSSNPKSPPNLTSRTISSTPSTHPAVLSIGYNPFYANKTRSIEIHILEPPWSSPSNNGSTAPLPEEFYGAPLNLLVLGFIRPEYDYVSKESLIDDIRTDCDVARKSLERGSYLRFEEPGSEWGDWLRDFRWLDRIEQGAGEGGKGGWEKKVEESEKEAGLK